MDARAGKSECEGRIFKTANGRSLAGAEGPPQSVSISNPSLGKRERAIPNHAVPRAAGISGMSQREGSRSQPALLGGKQ